MNKNYDIVMTGVGGQGLIKASDILAGAAFHAGFDVKKAEVHGLAQRGGSLFIQIRIGQEILSPLVDPGTAHVLLGFEKLETFRYSNWVSDDGIIIYDSLEIVPIGYARNDYPDDLEQRIESLDCRCIKTEAMKKAAELGNARMQNVLLLKELNSFLKLPGDSWKNSLEQCFKPRIAEANWSAFSQE